MLNLFYQRYKSCTSKKLKKNLDDIIYIIPIRGGLSFELENCFLLKRVIILRRYDIYRPNDFIFIKKINFELYIKFCIKDVRTRQHLFSLFLNLVYSMLQPIHVHQIIDLLFFILPLQVLCTQITIYFVTYVQWHSHMGRVAPL